MNDQVDPLAALRDIHLPADPGWWPPAPGWWMLLCITAAGVLFVWPRWRRQHHNRRVVRALESALDAIPLEGSAAERTRAIGQMSRLARQYAISRFGRRRVAALAGADWLAFLDRTSGTSEFTRGSGNLLGEGPYRPDRDGPDSDTLLSVKRNLLGWARACGTGRGRDVT